MRALCLLVVGLAACGDRASLDVLWQIDGQPAADRCGLVGADTVVVRVFDPAVEIDRVTAPCESASVSFTFDDPPATLRVEATLRGAGADLDVTETTISSDQLDALVVLDFSPP